MDQPANIAKFKNTAKKTFSDHLIMEHASYEIPTLGREKPTQR